MRADPKVFKRFRASLEIIKKMTVFSKHVTVSKEHDKKIHVQFKTMIFDEDYLLVLKFCAYLLRHHGHYLPITFISEDREI